MRRFDFTFKTINAWEMGVAVATRPSIPKPKMRGEFVEVAGRDGTLFVTDKTYEDIEFPIECNMVRGSETLMESYRRIKPWLNGSGELIFSDDADVFYNVKKMDIDDFSRRARAGADFEAVVVADPFSYFRSGKEKYDINDVKVNPYFYCKPIYIVDGLGDFVLHINEKTFIGKGGSMTIDSSKMIAYTANMSRAKTVGNYEDLYLQNGVNEIHISSGFNLKIIPNWRAL